MTSAVAAVAVVTATILTSGPVRAAIGVIVAVWILLVGTRASDPLGNRATEGASVIDGSGVDVTTRRVEVLDTVVAQLARRPWDPTLRPWTPDVQGVILLLPGAAYHLPEMVELGRELRRRGHQAVLGSGESHFERLADGLAWYPELEVLRVDDATSLDGFAAVVAMKDWASYGEVVRRAKAAGIPTLAKVEGAQDFEDVETPGERRRPYRHADLILCQGDNDWKALDGMRRDIVGSTRLERLRMAPSTHGQTPLVIVNYNFSYGVLADQARGWLQTVTEALRMTGLGHVISTHPSVRLSTRAHPSTSIPISRLLPQATLLVSRFSTVPFEAMARGIPFVYHNPHGERIPAFREPAGAFPVTETAEELAQVLADGPPPGESARRATDGFFGRQVSMDDRRSEERAADVIEDVMSQAGRRA